MPAIEHKKVYHSKQFEHEDSVIVVEGPVTSDHLRTLQMHPDLDAFRRPKEQHVALIEIAELPEGRIVLARKNNIIVGYVTFHYPDEMERWSEGGMEDLVELGAIEVADAFRCLGIGKKLIQLAFLEDQLENMIVFTTEYYWHWDLKGELSNVWDYRRMMEQLMKSVDMIWFATDDPEICSHPANCLMVRIGKDVPHASVERFDTIRFRQRFMF